MRLWSRPATDPDTSGEERGNTVRRFRHETGFGERPGGSRKPCWPAGGTAPPPDRAAVGHPLRRVRTGRCGLGAAGKSSRLLAFRIAAGPGPDGSGIRGPLRTMGELALRGAAQHAVEHAAGSLVGKLRPSAWEDRRCTRLAPAIMSDVNDR